jgi:hypothetical protein
VEGADEREMADGTNGDVDSILEKYKKEVPDRRRSRGDNHYAEFVFGAFEVIERFLAQGYSVNKIFQILVKEHVFEDNAERSNFYRALKRERLRREGRAFSLAAGRKGKADGKTKGRSLERKQERDGERVVSWNGRDVAIADNVPDDLKEGKKETYGFSDYPEYIQEAMMESARKGTALEDREKISRMVLDWKDRQASEGSEKENGIA